MDFNSIFEPMKAISLLLIFIFECHLSHSQIVGRVVNVHDGDTFTLVDSNNFTRTVRLQGIDCPELHQPYGYQSWQLANKLIYNKTVRIDSVGHDRYHRMIGVVYIPSGDTLNRILLRRGLAWQYRRYDTSAHAALLEANARERKAGLWSLPIEPWVWRRQSHD